MYFPEENIGSLFHCCAVSFLVIFAGADAEKAVFVHPSRHRLDRPILLVQPRKREEQVRFIRQRIISTPFARYLGRISRGDLVGGTNSLLSALYLTEFVSIAFPARVSSKVQSSRPAMTLEKVVPAQPIPHYTSRNRRLM